MVPSTNTYDHTSLMSTMLMTCKRNSITQLSELGTLGIDNSGFEHDRGKLICGTISVRAMTARPAATCARLAQ